MVGKSLLLHQGFKLMQGLVCGLQIPSCERELCRADLPPDQQFHLLPVLRDTTQRLQPVICLL